MLPSDVKHLAADSTGSVFASDGGRRIARLNAGWLENVAVLPSESRITGLAGLADESVAIADAGLNLIWRVDARGRAVALAGIEQPPALQRKPVSCDGPVAEARFRSPITIASSGAGELFVVEQEGHRAIVRTISGGTVTSVELAGMPQTSISSLCVADGTLVAVPAAGGPPAIVVLSRLELHRSGSSEVVWQPKTTIGSRHQRGSADGKTWEARFASPAAVTATGRGFAVADGTRIRLIDFERADTLAGSSPGYVDGHGAAARFGRLGALAATSVGEIYAADPENDALRVVNPEGDVSTVIGALRGDRISRLHAPALSKMIGNAIIDDDVREAWGIARFFLRDHRLGAQPWPDRTIQPTSVASARLGKELAASWSHTDDPVRSGVGLFCLWLIECDERDQGVNEIRDHRLRRTGEDLDRRAG